MSNEIKYGNRPGLNLVFTAFQPDGTGRGLPNQPMFETRNAGYYRATPITDLVSGDVVLVYNNETLTYEGEPLFCLTYDLMYYDGERLTYEGEWLENRDLEIDEIVTSVGYVIGSGEYNTVSADVAGLLVAGTSVTNVYDETGEDGSTGHSLTSTGVLKVESGDC